LQKCIDLKVGIWEDEGEVKTFGREAVAHKTNVDRRHSTYILKVQDLRAV
jgi:hypothetical protein